jgi:hypothetical protein
MLVLADDVKRIELEKRLMVSCHNIEINELKAQVERLTKAGNQSIVVGTKLREMVGDHHWSMEFDRVRTDWNAVKGGQP